MQEAKPLTLYVTRPDGRVDTFTAIGLCWAEWPAGDLRIWSPSHAVSVYKRGKWKAYSEEKPATFLG